MAKAGSKRIFYSILIMGCIVAAAKILFVGYDIDEQYAVSMSWRMLKGDRLLRDMWEPHQTSGGLCALLMGAYAAAFHTTEGIILYLRICGLLLHSMAGIFLYRTLRNGQNGKEHAFLVSCLYFFALPKIMFLPEFSNIQVWCLIAVSCCMLRYYIPCRGGRHALRYLVAAGCFMALEVLTYPSTILIFIVCVGGIVYYRQITPHSLSKELLCVTVPCLLGAVSFIAWLLTYVPAKEFWELVSVVMADGSHSVPVAERLMEHGIAFLQTVGFFVLYALPAWGLSAYRHRKSHRPFSGLAWCELFLLCTLTGQILIWLFADKYPNYPGVEHAFLLLFLLCAAARHKVKMSPVLVFCVLVSLAAFMGILLFSNHPFLVSLPFLAPCTIGILSLPELRDTISDEAATEGGSAWPGVRTVLLLWVCVMVFGRCYMQRTTYGRHYTILDECSLMREGPARGLIADTEAVIQYRDNLQLVREVLPKGAKVFYIGTNTDIYLMEELEFCTPSTISSPTFDDKVFLYFRKHPEKMPEYVACDVRILYSDLWVMDYIGEYCQDGPVAENGYLAIFQCR